MSREAPGFKVAPWELRWRHADPASLGLTASTFALSNGRQLSFHCALLDPRTTSTGSSQ